MIMCSEGQQNNYTNCGVEMKVINMEGVMARALVEESNNRFYKSDKMIFQRV